MINFKKCKKGGYGHYAKIDGVGHKIVGKGFKSKNSCIKSRDFYSALKEATYLKIAQSCKISPKFISIDVIKINDKYFPVLKMEHIPGRTLIKSIPFDSFHNCRVVSGKINLEKGIRVTVFIRNRLKKLRISHGDLHSNNIMVMPNDSVRVIDFGATTTLYLGNKKTFLKILSQIRKDFIRSKT